MERLHYKVMFADNGVIIKNTDSNILEVFEEKDSSEQHSDYREYTKRALSEGVAHYIADLLLDGSDNLELKDEFKINIEIR